MTRRWRRLVTSTASAFALLLVACGSGGDVSTAKEQGVELDGLAVGPWGTVAVTDLKSGFAIVDGSGEGSDGRHPRLLLTTPTGLETETLPTTRLANVSIWPMSDALVILGLPCENINATADVDPGESSWFEVCGTRSHMLLRYQLSNRSWKTLSRSVEGSDDGTLRVMASNGDILLAERGPEWLSINVRTGDVVEVPAPASATEAAVTACAIGGGFTAAVVPDEPPIATAPAPFSDTVGVFRLRAGEREWVKAFPEPTELETRIATPLGCGPGSVMFMALTAAGETPRPVQLVGDGPELRWLEGPLEGFPDEGPPPALISTRSTVTAWDGPELEAGGYAVLVLQGRAWRFVGRAEAEHPLGLGEVAVSGRRVLFLAHATDGQVLRLLGNP